MSVAADPMPTRTFVSFDGGVSARAQYQRPDRYRLIEADLNGRPRIARGGGYSYAAASFGAGTVVQDMTRFDRVLRFDPAARLIEVEAGITLADVLSVTGPAGLWLPVQPGYPEITIGGCVAANVNAKNAAHVGTFLGSVVDLTLFHPRHGTFRVDRASRADVFDLTCGGFGLTGVILKATLRLAPLLGSRVNVRRIPVGSLQECLASLRAAAARESFAYAWHDAAPGATFGRGVVYEGTIVPGPPPGIRTVVPRYLVLTPEARRRLPFSIWRTLTARVINSAYWRLETTRDQAETSVFDFLFPFARDPWYFLFFGRRGLAESQVLVPHEEAEGFLLELEQRIRTSRAPTVMISLKLFRGTRKLVRFDGDGVCVTLNLTRSPTGLAFLSTVDELTVAAGGIPNIIKDSRLPRSVVDRTYPEAQGFRSGLRAYDPGRTFRSELSERLGL